MPRRSAVHVRHAAHRATTQRDERAASLCCTGRRRASAGKAARRSVVLPYRRDMPARKRPTPEDSMTARRSPTSAPPPAGRACRCARHARTYASALAIQRHNDQFGTQPKRSSNGGAADHNGYLRAAPRQGPITRRQKKTDCDGPVHVCVDAEDEKLVCPPCGRTSFAGPAIYRLNDLILRSGPGTPVEA